MLSLILIILNIIIFVSYNVCILKRFGVPESLSITTYLTEKYYWIFPTICVLFTFTILPVWLNILPGVLDGLKFLACLGILFVGATPFFQNVFDGKIHYTAAIISTAAFMIWMLCSGFHWWIAGGLVLFILSLFIWGKKNVVYYGEVILWIMLLIVLMT